jgi:hypothetical protein
MTMRLPPKRLAPDAAQFCRRLKVYAWVVIGSPCTVLFVTG